MASSVLSSTQTVRDAIVGFAGDLETAVLALTVHHHDSSVGPPIETKEVFTITKGAETADSPNTLVFSKSVERWMAAVPDTVEQVNIFFESMLSFPGPHNTTTTIVPEIDEEQLQVVFSWTVFKSGMREMRRVPQSPANCVFFADTVLGYGLNNLHKFPPFEARAGASAHRQIVFSVELKLPVLGITNLIHVRQAAGEANASEAAKYQSELAEVRRLCDMWVRVPDVRQY